MTSLAIARYDKLTNESQTVETHLKNVLAFTQCFSEKIGLSSLGELVGIVHDFGKYSNAFQEYIKNGQGVRGEIDHSTAGAQFVWGKCLEQQPLSLLAMQMAALCIASHHSGLIDCLEPDGTNVFSKRLSKDSARSHFDEAKGKADGSISTHINKILSSETILSEIKDQCEACKAGHGESDDIPYFKLGLVTRFLFSSLIDADRLDAAGRSVQGKPEWTPLVKKLEKHLTRFIRKNRIDELRAEISDQCAQFSKNPKGVFRLSVPTGGGKTLASLRFAIKHAERHGMDRVIYVIPYTSIIDQNANIARGIFGNDVVLEHHSNLTPEKDTESTRILSENWDAPVIFTTTVQFFEALFSSGTQGARRMHQLANAVIIFDEAQTIPIKTIHLFNNAINFLAEQCKSTIIICTATQPLLDETDQKKGALRFSVNPEMVQKTDDKFAAERKITVQDKRKAGGWTNQEIADQIKNDFGQYTSVLVIANTKASARNIFVKCRGAIPGSVFHLSTNMCPAHRLAILENIRKRLDPKSPQPVICVSTQLIEAGVDVDFGCVIRAMAGLDSIAQATGRCNRNGLRKNGGKVLIVNPADENLDHLEEIRIAKNIGERVIGEYKDQPLDTEAMRQYYKYYFFDRAHLMDYPTSGNVSLLSLLSANAGAVEAYKQALRAAPPFLLRQSFATAGKAFEIIDAPTQGVIIPYAEGKDIIGKLCSSRDLRTERDLLKAAQRFSVSIRPALLKKLTDNGYAFEVQSGSGIYYLDERYYSHDFGISDEPVAEMSFLNG